MDKIVQYLIKSTHCFSHEGKSWEAIFSSLIHQGTKPPLQSKDPALFQRDWDRPIRIMRCCVIVERPRPVPKGLRQWRILTGFFMLCRKTPPCSKGIETSLLTLFNWCEELSKDPALFQRDWDIIFFCNICYCLVERPRPVPKGLRHFLFFLFDWVFTVERPRPVPKGLRQFSGSRSPTNRISRKTPPCSKGIET